MFRIQQQTINHYDVVPSVQIIVIFFLPFPSKNQYAGDICMRFDKHGCENRES